jgi:hypothetical protein
MLLCDYLIRDAETQNKSLIGIFNRILAQKYPVRHDRMHVFVALIDGHGNYEARLRIRASSGKVIFTSGGALQMMDPLAVAELNFQLRGLLIPEPGRYFVEFLCDGEILMDRTFDAALMESKPEPGQEGEAGEPR